MNLPTLLEHKSILVVAGSGGVGKTSTSAATAVMAALHTDRRVLVMTIDPARRLADTLGVGVGNHAVEVTSDRFTVDGVAPKGQLFAAMLDTKQSWDELIKRHAPDGPTVQNILANPLYRSITERFVQSHDYIAMERLYELHQSNEYDLIVIDTPPAAHATDFLDAPNRMADFFDSKLLRFLVAPSRSSFMSVTSKPLLHLADRILGRRLLEEVSEFFTLLESMRPGFIERAREVERLLASDATTFVTVTTLEPAPRKEALRFGEQLRSRNLHAGGVIVNRALPDYLSDPTAADAAARIQQERAGIIDALGGANGEATGQVLNELSANFERFRTLGEHERLQRETLTRGEEPLASVPWFGDDLHDVAGLLRLGEMIWPVSGSQTREIG